MTSRPVFMPLTGKKAGVKVETFAFTWSPGFAKIQKQKSIRSLHDAVLREHPDSHPLEVSSKSEEKLGKSLSAFNLRTFSEKAGKWMTVESVFQASKVFAGDHGSHPEWYALPPMEVRKLLKERAGVPLTGFQFGRDRWPLSPSRLFYDWIYCRVLHLNPALIKELEVYDCFTDIEFNPVRSINCQAYAVALYLSLRRCGVLAEALQSKEAFMRFHPAETVGLKHDNRPDSRSRGRGR